MRVSERVTISRMYWILCLALNASAQEKVDLNVIHRIKQEAFRNSKVMEHLHQLTDHLGPRLTASPQYDRAAEWTMGQFKEWGLSDVHLERWGPFGRSWSVDQYSVEMVKPGYAMLTAKPMAWASPTAGSVTAEAMLAPFAPKGKTIKALREEVERYAREYKGKLRGRIVLITKPKPVRGNSRPDFRRYTDAELQEQADAPPPPGRVEFDAQNPDYPEDDEALRKFSDYAPLVVQVRLWHREQDEVTRLNRFLASEGVAAVFTTDDRSAAGVVFAEGAGSYRTADAASPPKFALTREQYNRTVRLLEHKQAVTFRLNLKVTASEKDVDGTNILAEIPGTSKPEEVVMIGAHFDSWHTGTGATDNGTGSAVMIEAMRILKALGLKMNRTVRIGLWSGEEQGMYGSMAYVKQHFGDPETMQLKPEHTKLSVYFNHDNGTGKIRGVYLQENDAARPFFESVLGPFRDQGAKIVSIRNTGGTDHLSFDAVGLPGFQFVQDPAAYMTKTHHSEVDVYDNVEAGDLMQASAIVAAMVHEAANRAEMFPRKPLPAALRK